MVQELKEYVGKNSPASDPGLSTRCYPGVGGPFQPQGVCPYGGCIGGCGRPYQVAPYLPLIMWGGTVTDNDVFDGHTVMVFNG